MFKKSEIDRALHESGNDTLEQRIMELAFEHCGAQSGAIFLWNTKQKALAVDFHVVEGVTFRLPGAFLRHRTDGRPNGIALHVLQSNQSYLCADTAHDPHYARYFFDAASVVAVPISYQERAIGVLSLSSRKRNAFTTKHVEALQEIAGAAAKFLRRAQLERTSGEESGRPILIKGLSPEWLEVERRIERVSATAAPVLLQGESGTGKDLVARAIHFNSRRVGKPYVVVNCAAIPETLLESILFGHVRGAFTGANLNKIGEFKKAHRGTLFLDEIGELPMSLQAKLLRALDQGEIEPLGSNGAPERVDVRLLCATHRNVEEMVRAGTFREDLYFRICVLKLELPPLRSYKDNLEVLAAVFVQDAARRHQRPVTGISKPALARLAGYHYPGNVRELRNVLEHAVIMSASEEIQPQDLPPQILELPASKKRASESPATLATMREQWLAPLERDYLSALLQSSGGQVRAAARRANITPVTFYRLMARRGIRLERSPRT